MTTQLQLIERPDAGWRLDDTTRDIGRRGVAQARTALQAARARSVVRAGDAAAPADAAHADAAHADAAHADAA